MVVERKLIFLSIAELHFSLTVTHLIVGVIWRGLLFMMFPVHQISMIIGFILVVGSSNWKSGKFVITIVQTPFSPTDDSYSSLKHLSAIFVTKLYFPSRFCFTPRTCSFMSAFICLSHLSFHLYYSFLFMYAHYWISWWSRNSKFFNLEFRNCFVMLCRNFYDVIPFFILSSIYNSSKHFKYMFDYCVR